MWSDNINAVWNPISAFSVSGWMLILYHSALINSGQIIDIDILQVNWLNKVRLQFQSKAHRSRLLYGEGAQTGVWQMSHWVSMFFEEEKITWGNEVTYGVLVREDANFIFAICLARMAYLTITMFIHAYVF